MVSVLKLNFCCTPGKHYLSSPCLRRRCFLPTASHGKVSEHLRSGSQLPSQRIKVSRDPLVPNLYTDSITDIAPVKKSRRKKGGGAGVVTDEAGDLVNGGISGTESEGQPHRPSRPRTRPIRARAAKDKAPTATSSSENDDEEEDGDVFGAKRATGTRPSRKSHQQPRLVAGEAREDKESDAGAMEIDPAEELEPDESGPVVLNGSPFATPSRGKKRPRPEDEPESNVAPEEDASNDVSKFPRRKHKKVKL